MGKAMMERDRSMRHFIGRGFDRLRPGAAFSIVLLALLLGAHTATAQTAGAMNSTLDAQFGAHEPARNFLETLKKVTAADDKSGFADLIDFPLQTRISGHKVILHSRGEFLSNYDKLVTGKVKSAIARQNYTDLFVNWRGAMIGDGEIWFSPLENSQAVKITAINN